MCYLSQTFKRHRAFTLIELLAVIAILAVLATLLFPTLRSIQQKAGSAKCVSNMRAIGAGVALFAAENDGKFPRGGWPEAGTILDPPVPGGTLPWLADLYPYVGQNRKIFICPNGPKVGPDGQGAWATMPGSGWSDPLYPFHYGYNTQLNTLWPEAFRSNNPPLHVDRRQNAKILSGVPVMIEVVFQNCFYGFTDMFSPEKADVGTAFATRHANQGNVLWGDGSVSSLTRQEWASMPEKKVTGASWRYWRFCIGDY